MLDLLKGIGTNGEIQVDITRLMMNEMCDDDHETARTPSKDVNG